MIFKQVPPPPMQCCFSSKRAFCHSISPASPLHLVWSILLLCVLDVLLELIHCIHLYLALFQPLCLSFHINYLEYLTINQIPLYPVNSCWQALLHFLFQYHQFVKTSCHIDQLSSNGFAFNTLTPCGQFLLLLNLNFAMTTKTDKTQKDSSQLQSCKLLFRIDHFANAK